MRKTKLRHFRNRIGPPLPRTPWLDETNENDVKLIRRLLKRRIPKVSAPDDYDCCICYSKTHNTSGCPCKIRIPKGSNVIISPRYDTACRRCGAIGLECCSVGSYAFLKMCLFCKEPGHWFWEQRCKRNHRFQPNPNKYFAFKSIRDNDIVPRHRPKVPPFPTDEKENIEEILRLMKRERTEPVQPGCCDICYAKDHRYYDCSFLKTIPQGSPIGPTFDEVCIACGTLGMRCCSQGSYATLKYCYRCNLRGHWYWEDNDKCCSKCLPSTAREWATFKNEHCLPQYKDVVRDLQNLTT